MVKAFFVDFYGTVVHEDGQIIKKITDIICDTGKVLNRSDVGSYWWKEFQTLCENAFDEQFETQRELERISLKHTLERFSCNANVDELSSMMFEHWMKPPIFEDAKEFFKRSRTPIIIVSNIDTADIMKAIEYHELTPAGVYTSEDARAYKPRKELFELALKGSGLKADEVIHIGDSLSSDVKGAMKTGIKPLWLNREHKQSDFKCDTIYDLTNAYYMAQNDTKQFLSW